MKKSLSMLEARQLLGLTQTQLAEMLDITAEYISMIENGRKPMSKKMLNKLDKIVSDSSSTPTPPSLLSVSAIGSVTIGELAARVEQLESRLANIERLLIKMAGE